MGSYRAFFRVWADPVGVRPVIHLPREAASGTGPPGERQVHPAHGQCLYGWLTGYNEFSASVHTSRLWKRASLFQTEPSTAWPQGKWSVWSLTLGLGAERKLISLPECSSFLNGCLSEWMRGYILALIHIIVPSMVSYANCLSYSHLSRQWWANIFDKMDTVGHAGSGGGGAGRGGEPFRQPDLGFIHPEGWGLSPKTIMRNL